MTAKWKNLSAEDAFNLIQMDNKAFDFLAAHSGFFSPERPFRHPVHLDNKVIVWPPVDIHPNATIGEKVVIGRYTNIVGNITIGKGTRIQGFCFIPDGITIGECVFIGPHVCFTNMKYPKVRNNMLKDYVKTVIEDDVSIGAGAIICPGVTIGRGALIGAGAVVTKDIPPETVITGIPARIYRVNNA